MNSLTTTTQPLRLRAASWGAAVITVAALLCYTLLKAHVDLPFWSAEAHQVRAIRAIPFNEFVYANVWYGPPLNVLGNTALFIPVGFLLVQLLRPRRPYLTAAANGFAASLLIEIAQFVFAVGYSDIDDLIFNTLGAVLGALLARRLGPRGQSITLGIIIAACLLVLVPFAVALT